MTDCEMSSEECDLIAVNDKSIRLSHLFNSKSFAYDQSSQHDKIESYVCVVGPDETESVDRAKKNRANSILLVIKLMEFFLCILFSIFFST